jgi:multidrug efflux pump subunit AcrB
VQSTVVRRDADSSLGRVQDLASHIGLDYRDPIVIASIKGKPSVGFKQIKSEDGNAMSIRDQVAAAVDQLRPSLATQGIEVVLTQGSTVYIKDGLTTARCVKSEN